MIKNMIAGISLYKPDFIAIFMMTGGFKMNDHVGRGLLSDADIKNLLGKHIKITSPGNETVKYSEKQIQVGSIDLHFQREFKRIHVPEGTVLTYDMIEKHSYTEEDKVVDNGRLHIEPGEILLTTTLETIRLSPDVAGFVFGRSSIARLGIMVHCAQAFINPGHGSTIPLQIVNMAPCPVELNLEVPICQLVLMGLNTPATVSYSEKSDSKYKYENSPGDSKVYLDKVSHSLKAEIFMGDMI